MLLYIDMEEVDPSIAEIERAMTAIRRSQARRSLARLAAEHDPAVFEVLDAVIGAEGEGLPATVTVVAERLGIDQPRASRLVTRTVDRGLLGREPDRGDGRRVRLVSTERGREEFARARRFRQAVFARATAGWSASDRATFARLLTRFVADLARETRRDARGPRHDGTSAPRPADPAGSA
jgi:Transcriptional regulators